MGETSNSTDQDMLRQLPHRFAGAFVLVVLGLVSLLASFTLLLVSYLEEGTSNASDLTPEIILERFGSDLRNSEHRSFRTVSDGQVAPDTSRDGVLNVAFQSGFRSKPSLAALIACLALVSALLGLSQLMWLWLIRVEEESRTRWYARFKSLAKVAFVLSLFAWGSCYGLTKECDDVAKQLNKNQQSWDRLGAVGMNDPFYWEKPGRWNTHREAMNRNLLKQVDLSQRSWDLLGFKEITRFIAWSVTAEFTLLLIVIFSLYATRPRDDVSASSEDCESVTEGAPRSFVKGSRADLVMQRLKTAGPNWSAVATLVLMAFMFATLCFGGLRRGLAMPSEEERSTAEDELRDRVFHDAAIGLQRHATGIEFDAADSTQMYLKQEYADAVSWTWNLDWESGRAKEVIAILHNVYFDNEEVSVRVTYSFEEPSAKGHVDILSGPTQR